MAIHVLCMYITILLLPAHSFLFDFFFFLWAWEHVHQACRVTQQKQTLEIVRFCPCKWHGTNACSGLKYVHPDRNLLLEVKKPPVDSSRSIGGCCGWECRARTAGFSSSRLQLCLLRDSQLWVDHTLVLACSFSSFHVFRLFLKIYGWEDLVFCLVSSKACLSSLINNCKVTRNWSMPVVNPSMHFG